MPRNSEFVDFVIEQMTPIGVPRVRRMFGGYGLYDGEAMFALIAYDRLYFKADAVSRPEFEAEGLNPFVYEMRGRTVSMSYYEAPPEVFEDSGEMREWMHKAMAAARRAREVKQNKKRDNNL